MLTSLVQSRKSACILQSQILLPDTRNTPCFFNNPACRINDTQTGTKSGTIAVQVITEFGEVMEFQYAAIGQVLFESDSPLKQLNCCSSSSCSSSSLSSW